ncbi:MAG: hypothetical protein IK009_05630 [Bacteroidales bacterium]|nr:hypothetical protein [Bacteroidales bacterium]
MKRIISIVFASLALLTAVSCTKGLMEDLNNLKGRVTDLETIVSNINEYYVSTSKIVAALEDHDMIRSITPVKNNNSYLVTFASGQTLTLIQGIDGMTPNLGIRKYTDGIYYWTVQYGSEEPQWLLSNLGLKVRASGLTPQMKIEDGWWQYSYDGGGTWTRLCKATGEAGSSVFKNISISDSFVTFTLTNGGVFQIPTEAYFQRLIDKCNSVNKEFETARDLLAKVDTSMAVKTISQIMEAGEVVGYKLVLNNGKVLEIRNGKDQAPFTFAIKRNYDDWLDYWTVKIGDGDFTWLYKNNGEMAQASSMSGTPRLAVRDTLGAFYYVYSFYPNTNDYQWLRDPEGNLVAADPYSRPVLFKAVTVGAESVALTLGDDSIIYIPLYYAQNPVISFTPPPGVTYNAATYLYSAILPNTPYAVGYTIKSVPANLQIEAIGLDGATVTNLTKLTSGADLVGTISFTTPVAFPNPAGTTRVLVFLTWGSNVTMQVLEFKNGS